MKCLKLSSAKLAIALLVILFSFSLFPQKEVSALEISYPELPGGVTLPSNPTFPQWISYIFQFSVMMGGVTAFFSLLYGGFKYIASRGSPLAITEAKDHIISSLIGLLLLLSVYLIATVINPQLTIIELDPKDMANIGQTSDIPPPPPEETEISEELSFGAVIDRIFHEDDSLNKIYVMASSTKTYSRHLKLLSEELARLTRDGCSCENLGPGKEDSSTPDPNDYIDAYCSPAVSDSPCFGICSFIPEANGSCGKIDNCDWPCVVPKSSNEKGDPCTNRSNITEKQKELHIFATAFRQFMDKKEWVNIFPSLPNPLYNGSHPEYIGTGAGFNSIPGQTQKMVADMYSKEQGLGEFAVIKERLFYEYNLLKGYEKKLTIANNKLSYSEMLNEIARAQNEGQLGNMVAETDDKSKLKFCVSGGDYISCQDKPTMAEKISCLEDSETDYEECKNKNNPQMEIIRKCVEENPANPGECVEFANSSEYCSIYAPSFREGWGGATTYLCQEYVSKGDPFSFYYVESPEK